MTVGRCAATRRSRRAARGRCSRRGARSSPSPPRRATCGTLTNTPAASERDPAWSPDGKPVAYLLRRFRRVRAGHRAHQDGMGTPQPDRLGNPPSFFYAPLWSPDSKKIAYTDKRLNLWYVDIDKGDAGRGSTPTTTPTPVSTSTPPGRPTSAGSPTPSSCRATCTRSSPTRSTRQDRAAHRRHERRALSRVRRERQVPLLHRQHRHRARARRGSTCRAIQRPVTRSVYVAVLAKDRPLAARPGERRREDRRTRRRTSQARKQGPARRAKAEQGRRRRPRPKDGEKKDEPPK